MEEMDYFQEEGPEEEEEISQGEGTNRTFIILVAAFGSILALGICAFVLWALVGNRWAQNQIAASNANTEATGTAVVSAMATPDDEPETTETASPATTPSATPAVTQSPAADREQDTPSARMTTPTPTRTPRATTTGTVAAATREPATPTRTPAQVAEGATALPTTAHNSPDSNTPGNEAPLATPETGLGTLGVSALAVGLLVLLVVVRQMRRST
jgi:hypothetical protein